MRDESPIAAVRWPAGIPSTPRDIALHVCRTFLTDNSPTTSPYLASALHGITGAEVSRNYESARYKKSEGYDKALLEAHRDYRDAAVLWAGLERLRLSSLITTLHTLRDLVAGGETERTSDGKIIREFLREEWKVADPPTRDKQTAFVEAVVKTPHVDLVGAV